MKDFFKRMLSEDNGNPSTTRWGVFNAIFMIWVLVLSVLFIIYKSLPEGLIYAVGSVMVIIAGIFLTAKVTQKRFENGQSKEETEITK